METENQNVQQVQEAQKKSGSAIRSLLIFLIIIVLAVGTLIYLVKPQIIPQETNSEVAKKSFESFGLKIQESLQYALFNPGHISELKITQEEFNGIFYTMAKTLEPTNAKNKLKYKIKGVATDYKNNKVNTQLLLDIKDQPILLKLKFNPMPDATSIVFKLEEVKIGELPIPIKLALSLTNRFVALPPGVALEQEKGGFAFYFDAFYDPENFKGDVSVKKVNYKEKEFIVDFLMVLAEEEK